MADGVNNGPVHPRLTSATKFKRITDVVRIELLHFGVLGPTLGAKKKKKKKPDQVGKVTLGINLPR